MLVIQLDKWALTTDVKGVSAMSANLRNHADNEFGPPKREKVRHESRVLRQQSSELVTEARRILSKSQRLIRRPHVHRCLSCKTDWQCKHEVCELKWLCLCLDCHRR